MLVGDLPVQMPLAQANFADALEKVVAAVRVRARAPLFRSEIARCLDELQQCSKITKWQLNSNCELKPLLKVASESARSTLRKDST